MNKPLFSIITCTYNSQKFIKKNLESVKAQIFMDYEQIIIEGQSSDKTVEIVKSFQKNNPKIKLFSYPAKGISDAFNKGIKHSKGKYLFFLNSDDSFYDKNVLKNVSNFLIQNPKLDWIYGKINVVEENGKSVGVFPNRKIFQTANRYLLKFFNFIPHQAVFMKKEVFEKFGEFENKLTIGMDYEYWLRIFNKTKWEFYNKPISNYMIHKDSKSSSLENKIINIKTIDSFQGKYLNTIEIFFAKIVNQLVTLVNKTYR